MPLLDGSALSATGRGSRSFFSTTTMPSLVPQNGPLATPGHVKIANDDDATSTRRRRAIYEAQITAFVDAAEVVDIDQDALEDILDDLDYHSVVDLTDGDGDVDMLDEDGTRIIAGPGSVTLDEDECFDPWKAGEGKLYELSLW